MDRQRKHTLLFGPDGMVATDPWTSMTKCLIGIAPGRTGRLAANVLQTVALKGCLPDKSGCLDAPHGVRLTSVPVAANLQPNFASAQPRPSAGPTRAMAATTSKGRVFLGRLKAAGSGARVR